MQSFDRRNCAPVLDRHHFEIVQLARSHQRALGAPTAAYEVVLVLLAGFHTRQVSRRAMTRASLSLHFTHL